VHGLPELGGRELAEQLFDLDTDCRRCHLGICRSQYLGHGLRDASEGASTIPPSRTRRLLVRASFRETLEEILDRGV
jgi:hypothetical protein